MVEIVLPLQYQGQLENCNSIFYLILIDLTEVTTCG